jgi:hypothetical protein
LDGSCDKSLEGIEPASWGTGSRSLRLTPGWVVDVQDFNAFVFDAVCDDVGQRQA